MKRITGEGALERKFPEAGDETVNQSGAAIPEFIIHLSPEGENQHSLNIASRSDNAEWENDKEHFLKILEDWDQVKLSGRKQAPLQSLLDKNLSLAQFLSAEQAEELIFNAFKNPFFSKKKVDHLIKKCLAPTEVFNSEKGKAALIDIFRESSSFDKKKADYLLVKNPALAEAFNDVEGFIYILKYVFNKEKVDYLLAKNPALAGVFYSEIGHGIFIDIFEEHMYRGFSFNKKKADYFLEKNPALVEANSGKSKASFSSIFKRFSLDKKHESLCDKEKMVYLFKKNPNLIEVLLDDIGHFECALSLMDGTIPGLNINYKNSGGFRLIDKAREFYDSNPREALKLIQKLREAGSVEPRNPLIIEGDIGKIDLNNNKLDDYEPNKANALRIMQKLFRKYPLRADQFDDEINAFKVKHSRNLETTFNTVWGGGDKDIVQIIDELFCMRTVRDRLPENWDFKQVLASIMHVARTTDDAAQTISSNLIYTLSQLKLCNLGKLLNLLYVVQDKVIGEAFQLDQQECAALSETSFEAIKQAFGHDENAVAEAINKWAYQIFVSKVKPEEWTPSTLVIQGAVNQSLLTLSAGQKMSSGHFIVLKDQVIPTLIKQIRGEAPLPASLCTWKKAYDLGSELCFTEFLKKLVENPAGMGSAFDEVLMGDKFLFGQFENVGIRAIECYYSKMIDTNPAYTQKMISGMLNGECSFSEEVTAHLAKILILENLHTKLQQLSTSELAQSGKKIVDEMMRAVLATKDYPPSVPEGSFDVMKGYLEGDGIEIIGEYQ